MRQLYIIIFLVLALCLSCQWKMRPSQEEGTSDGVTIERYDRVESLYLKEADFAALQQMKTNYPAETRTLIEDVLKLGPVDAPDINTRFLLFFQDSTLQTLLEDVACEYETMDDINKQLSTAFAQLRQLLPGIEAPRFYTQVGSLDQSITVGKGLLGISLDKYLGEEHPLYLRYGYSEQQRLMMTRQYIVPDCVGFYLLSLYPLPSDTSELSRHQHMGKIQHIVNRALNRRFFDNDFVSQAEALASGLKKEAVEQWLRGSSL